MTYSLVIGNKNTSSWSLRPWIALSVAGIAFEEININLRDPDAKRHILQHSPSGKVPALILGGDVIWDSLAILEFLAESHPAAGLWPADRAARARARAISAEMHSGFQTLRQECPMDFVSRHPRSQLSQVCAQDVGRIVAIWSECRRRFGAGGPYLFGAFSAADAMYAPVASRFATYVPDLSPYGDAGDAQRYVRAMMEMPAMLAWEAGARAQLAGKG